MTEWPPELVSVWQRRETSRTRNGDAVRWLVVTHRSSSLGRVSDVLVSETQQTISEISHVQVRA